jgi:plasmid stabilization system protein ParE
MTVVYHPAVQREVGAVLRHYDRISPSLGDAFWDELMAWIEAARVPPERFHLTDRGLRRVNLKRFPYHVLNRQVATGIRVIVVRHHRRHPSYGIKRR